MSYPPFELGKSRYDLVSSIFVTTLIFNSMSSHSIRRLTGVDSFILSILSILARYWLAT